MTLQPQWVKPLPYDQTVVVEGVNVTMLDANQYVLPHIGDLDLTAVQLPWIVTLSLRRPTNSCELTICENTKSNIPLSTLR